MKKTLWDLTSGIVVFPVLGSQTWLMAIIVDTEIPPCEVNVFTRILINIRLDR